MCGSGRPKPSVASWNFQTKTLVSCAVTFPSLIFKLVKRDFEKRHFNFNRIFQEPSTQEQVFQDVSRNIIKAVCDGYNGSILAYGQTGTGKTYTMIGNDDGI